MNNLGWSVKRMLAAIRTNYYFRTLIFGLTLTAGWTLNEFIRNNHFIDKAMHSFAHKNEPESKYFTIKDYNFIADAAQKIMHSVVSIKIKSSNDQGVASYSAGSGIMIDDQGLILTNAHVIADYIEDGQIIIITHDNEEFEGTYFSMDSKSDLAVIKCNPQQIGHKWKTAQLGSDCHPRVGEWVIAVGSPLGLNHTVTAGIISSLSRKSQELGNHESSMEYIQTDCKVHQGSSGGPLINIQGQVIGVLTARTNIEGVSFAIPIDDALAIIKCLKQQKKIIRPTIGAKMISLQDANRMKLSDSFVYSPDQKGVLVTLVSESSPAESGGLLKGDIITFIDGDPISNTHQVIKKIGLRINEEIHLTILRNIPFEQDWSGRTFTFFTEVKEIVVKTSDL